MKTAGAIRHQIQQATFRYLKKILDKNLRVAPDNCASHRDLQWDSERSFGFCSHAEQMGLRCSAVEDAKGCSFYKDLHHKEALKTDFKDFLATASLAEIAVDYADIAAMLWVLQEEAPNRDLSLLEVEPPTLPKPVEEVQTPALPEEEVQAPALPTTRSWWLNPIYLFLSRLFS